MNSARKTALHLIICFVGIVVFSNYAHAAPIVESDSDILQLDLDDLMDLTITSVSKKEQKYTKVASAVFVLTQEDIRRSMANSIPELLRTVPGISVQRIKANEWSISARGFDGQFANKLLVLVDGRTVYNPVFSGTYWDVQDMPLEDIEQIEVIRGPGATVWGSNAVNGVINIITKSASDTQGALVSGGVGSEERGFATIRYGTEVFENAHGRVYGKFYDHDNFESPTGEPSNDSWYKYQGGGRLDWQKTEADLVTFQGDMYYEEADSGFTTPLLSAPFSEVHLFNVPATGVNGLMRWTHKFSDDSEFVNQAYFDRYTRDTGQIDQKIETYDEEMQYRLPINSWNDLIMGANYRHIASDVNPGSAVEFIPSHRILDYYNAFIQDEMALGENLAFTAGTKVEDNPFSGFEIQPSARIAWTPGVSTLWAAVSRAVRIPQLANDDVNVDAAAFPIEGGLVGLLSIEGNRESEAEEMIAYEVGARSELVTEKLFGDIAFFFNDYSNLLGQRTGMGDFVLTPTPHVVIPATFTNGLEGESYGVELLLDAALTDWWRLVGSYTLTKMHIDENGITGNAGNEDGVAPENQAYLRSSVTLPYDVEFDTLVRYVDKVEAIDIDSYVELDLRLAYHLTKNLEIAIVGRNLVDDSHLENAPAFVTAGDIEVQREVFGKITWRN